MRLGENFRTPLRPSRYGACFGDNLGEFGYRILKKKTTEKPPGRRSAETPANDLLKNMHLKPKHFFHCKRSEEEFWDRSSKAKKRFF